jgi:hypothetical protein
VKESVDGIEFHSKKEAKRYSQLKELERTNKIRNLVLQPRFTLQEAYKDNEGKHVRAIEYVADFMYTDDLGHTIVEDVKGFKTETYALKIKIFKKLCHQYIFKEVSKV